MNLIVALALAFALGYLMNIKITAAKRKFRRKVRKMFGPKTIGHIRNGRRVL